MPDSADTFACPACQKQFRWSEKVAGRKVRCSKCESKFRIPLSGGQEAELLEGPPQPELEPEPASDPGDDPGGDPGGDQTYDLDWEEPERRSPSRAVDHDGSCPSCGSQLKPGAVICVNCDCASSVSPSSR